jgi:hypothetical protein
MAWQNIGNAGDLYVKADPSSGLIMLGSPSGGIAITVLDAAYLAVLLDEAIGAAKGQAVKLNEDDGA